jgi:putative component of membrane protein insertase Oxa1/YidC/SpoIIIJ protein YidD
MRNFAVALLSAPIHVYRAIVSPLLPKSCRFTPRRLRFTVPSRDCG